MRLALTSTLLALLTLAGVSFLFGAEPTWARKATAFPSECDPSSAQGEARNPTPRGALSPPIASCKRLRIPAPDGKSSVEVDYRAFGESRHAYLRLITPGRGTREAALPDGFQDIDLLWAPDSKAFFVNGGNGGGYWGLWVYVYRVDDAKLSPINITHQAQRDMVRAFPPCKATYLDKKTCTAMESEPEYNMTGIDWVRDSSTVVVMAEVPCTSSYGGIMCQVMGYELEVPTGRILKKMTAQQLRANWQQSMAWKLRVPEPPDYCEEDDRKLPRCAGHS